MPISNTFPFADILPLSTLSPSMDAHYYHSFWARRTDYCDHRPKQPTKDYNIVGAEMALHVYM